MTPRIPRLVDILLSLLIAGAFWAVVWMIRVLVWVAIRR